MDTVLFIVGNIQISFKKEMKIRKSDFSDSIIVIKKQPSPASMVAEKGCFI